MDPLTAAAASGLRSRIESLDMLANNLANASTGGFKVDHEFYSTYIGQDSGDESESSTGQMPVVQKPWTDFSQGTLQETGHPLDVALSGPGFFGLNGSSGPLYTRNGSFQLSSSGVLTSADGYPVRLQGGATLTVKSHAPLQIDRDGQIRQSGQLLGRLEITDFKDTGQLYKVGATNFRAGPGAGAAPATKAQAHQAALESSNVAVAESAVRLVTLMRHSEGLQKAINVATQMNQQSIAEIARVNS